MAGIINIYVTKEGEVLRIANSKYDKNELISELSLKEVLHTQIAYDTVDRKPYSILGVWFNRFSLNEFGQHIENTNSPSMQNYLNYSLASAESLSESNHPLIIPAAPVLPTQFEKECLIGYLKEKYPLIWENSPQAIELTIKKLQDVHKQYVDLIKKASCLRRRNSLKVE